MSKASSWGDLVVGIDIHFELVPTPVPTPTPFPHPHVSIIWDPVGYVVGEVTGVAFAALVGAPIAPAGPVLVDGSMGTVVGDAASMPIKHIIIPPGTTFVTVVTPSDAELMAGSQTVQFRGASAVRAGEVALPCSEPLPLPTGAVVSIPKGPGVTMVGGPPGLSLGSLASMLGLKALRNKWSAGKLHKLAAKIIPEKMQRLRRLVHKSVCFFTGHPVNVATGGVSTSAVDLSLPGPIPVVLERDYDTNWFDRAGPLGRGWSHSLDSRLWVEAGRVVLLTEDGRELEFNTRALPDGVMRAGDTLWHPVERVTLRALGHHRWEVAAAAGLVRRYGPVRGEPHDDARRGCSRITAIVDAAGHEVTFGYDDRARLEVVVDSCGRTVNFEHDAADRLRRVWLPAPDGNGMRQHVEYRYNDAGDLVEAKDATGKPTRLEYDDHLLVRETDRNGLSFYFEYDGYGRFARCTRTWGDGGIYDHRIDYDRPGRTTVVANSLGEVTAYAMNPLGLVTSIRRPNGSEIAYEYDLSTRLTAEVDELGGRTTHGYDARGNRIRTEAPDGAVVTTQFDDQDRPVAVTEAGGGRWEAQYDRGGNLASRTDPLGRTTRYGHEGGQLTTIVDPAGGVTRLSWSGRRELVAATYADDTTERWQHDALGRVVAATDVGGNVQRRQYDAVGRVVRVDEPDGNVRQLQWDAEGNLVRARDRLRDVTMTRFGLGQLASRTIGGKTIRYDHDTEGQLVAVINEAGHAHRFEREPGGEIRAEIAFDALTKVYERDAAGRLQRLIRPGVGRFTTFEYDAAGRLLHAEHSDGGFVRHNYDADGQLVGTHNEHAAIEFVRDASGQVVEERTTTSDDCAWVRSKYDHADRRIGLRSSLGADVSIGRNAVGDVTRIGQYGKGVAAWEAKFTRNAFGQEVDRQLPGGARSYWWRDALGRATQHSIGNNRTSARLREYSWSPGGRLSALSDDAVGRVEHGHDARGILTRLTHDDGSVQHRAADDVGNLFDSLAADDRQYGLAGELLKRQGPDGMTTYRYDSDGNLERRDDPDGGQWRYTWGDDGMLRQVDRPDGTAVAMRYDPLGRRIARSHAGVETRWLWDGDVKLHEWTEAAPWPEPALDAEEHSRLAFLERSHANFEQLYGADAAAHMDPLLADGQPHPRAQAVYRQRVAPTQPAEVTDEVITCLYAPESFAPLARLTKDSAHAIITDHVDAPLAVMDARGEVAASFSHDLHGNPTVLSGDGSLCPHRWAGQYYDAQTGLHENRFRYYDPGSGRYLSRDPLGLRGGLSAYAYVDDPTTQIDPLGLAGKPAAGAGCGAGGSPEHLKRFGSGPESASELAADAAKAEAHGFPHGVSTRLGKKPERRSSPHRSSPRAEVEEHFEVEQTGKDPRHHTVHLPNPVTDEAAEVFNRLFRQKG